MKKKIISTFKYVFVCTVLSVLLVVLYLSVHGFPAKITDKLISRIGLVDYAFTIEKLKLSVLEGIIATDVKCFRKGSIGSPLLTAEKVWFYLNPVGWWTDNQLLFGAKIEQAELLVLIEKAHDTDKTGPEKKGYEQIVLENLGASFNVDRNGKISVNNLKARLWDITLKGNGIILPAKKDIGRAQPGLEPTPGLADKFDHEPALRTFSTIFRQIEFESPPVIEVLFTADPDDMARLDLKINAEMGGVSFKTDSLERLKISAKFQGPNAEFLMEIKNMLCQETEIKQLQTWFTLNSGILHFKHLQGIIGHGAQKGPIEFNGTYEPATRLYKGYARSEVDPGAVTKTLRKFDFINQAEALEDFGFSEELPRGNGILTGRIVPGAWFKMIGFGQTQNASYREVPFLSAKSALYFDFSDTTAIFATMPIFVKREEGVASGDIVQDYERAEIDFNCESTVNPLAVAQVIGPFLTRIVEQFRFEGPMHIKGSGTAAYNDMENNDMEFEAIGDNVGALSFLAEKCSAKMRVTGTTVDITDITGTIYNGPFTGTATIYETLGLSNVYYETAGQVHNAEFEQLLAALKQNRTDTRGGLVSADFMLKGFAGPGMGPSVTGNGRVGVSRGRVFQLPLFGGLSDILTKYVPGMGALLSQTDANASFIVENSRVKSNNISVEGNVFSLTGHGAYHFNDTLDFIVQVTFMRSHTAVSKYIVRPLTRLVTKALEVRLSGNISDPEWRSVYSPREWLFR